MVALVVASDLHGGSLHVNDFCKNIAWKQAQPVFGLDARHWRTDFAGRFIYWPAYEDRSHPYGWELGHILARIEGGSDHLHNIQAEHWTTNLSKEALRKQQARLSMHSLSGGNMEVQRMLAGDLPSFM